MHIFFLDLRDVELFAGRTDDGSRGVRIDQIDVTNGFPRGIFKGVITALDIDCTPFSLSAVIM